MSARKLLQRTPWPVAASLGLCLGLLLGSLVTAARAGHLPNDADEPVNDGYAEYWNAAGGDPPRDRRIRCQRAQTEPESVALTRG